MTASICPICGENDAVQNIRSILSSGTSTQSSVTVGYIDGHIAPMVTRGQSTSNLVQRLSPPRIPGVLSYWQINGPFWLFNVVCAFVLMAIYTGIPGDVLGLVFFWLLYLIPAIGIGIVGFMPFWWLINRRPAQRRAWENNDRYFASMYYCSRDDVLFDAVGNYGTPESFIPRIFAARR
jgi:hypothetical protein